MELENEITTLLTKHEAAVLEREKEDISAFTFEACPYEGTLIRVYMNNYPSTADHLRGK